VIFECLPAVITNLPASTKIGDTIKINLLELLPSKKGPVAVKCRYLKRDGGSSAIQYTLLGSGSSK
jgi:hypothetical protein